MFKLLEYSVRSRPVTLLMIVLGMSLLTVSPPAQSQTLNPVGNKAETNQAEAEHPIF